MGRRRKTLWITLTDGPMAGDRRVSGLAHDGVLVVQRAIPGQEHMIERHECRSTGLTTAAWVWLIAIERFTNATIPLPK